MSWGLIMDSQGRDRRCATGAGTILVRPNASPGKPSIGHSRYRRRLPPDSVRNTETLTASTSFLSLRRVTQAGETDPS